MMPDAPKIDTRTAADVAAEVEADLEATTPWRATTGGGHDAGGALVRIFGRFAELVIERLNQLPGKSFLAFLDLIGTRLQPPQPARAPLTFQLAAGAVADALVPAGTRVAAQPREGEAGDPPVFETERDLVVTRSRLAAILTREPERDLWSDYGAFVATSDGGGPAFSPFAGTEPIAHRLYVGHRALLSLPGTKSVTVYFNPLDVGNPWPEKVAWEGWDGEAWRAFAHTVGSGEGLHNEGVWKLKLEEVPPLPSTTVSAALAGEWEPTALGLEDSVSSWLRCRWTEPLPPGAEPQLPEIAQVTVYVEIDEPDHPPPLGFSGQDELDLTKDFLPFGAEPKVGSTFYLAADEIFAQPGARVELEVTLSLIYFDEAGAPLPPNASNAPDQPPLRLVWEFWDGGDWALLGESGYGADTSRNGTYSFFDDTGGFRRITSPPYTVRFVCPFTVAAREVNGEEHKWLRVRIAQGHYGLGHRYVEGGTNGFQLELGDLRPPSVARLRQSWSFRSIDNVAQQDATPDRVFFENDFVLTPWSAGEPVTPFHPTADHQPTLYLGFARPGDAVGFANRATALYFRVPESLYERSQDGGYEAAESALEWEYWNGAGWKQLGARDETSGLSRRGVVTFIGPPDLVAAPHLGRVAFWLRARLERGEAAAARLEAVLTNTMWASHVETIAGEVLGSSRGEPGQVFRATRPPILPGQALEVREPEVPAAAELEEVRDDEGEDAVAVDRDAAGQALGVRVRWHEVADFHASGPRSRHYTVDRLNGEVRFGDGRRGLVPPAGRGNVRLASYRTGGGEAGNRETRTLTQLKAAVPYVDAVVNLEPAAGGAAAEDLAAAERRGPRSLRHRGRAVALADFEDLAAEASPRVARARAIGAPVSPAGTVGIVVVPRAAAARPVPSLELLDRVRDYVEARLEATVELWLSGPDWLRLDVTAEIVPERLEDAANVRAAALERLAAFLHPLTGGPDGAGWAFGHRPRRSDLFPVIERTPGVDHVRLLVLDEHAEEGSVRADRFLVYSGDHRISLFGSTDEVFAP